MFKASLYALTAGALLAAGSANAALITGVTASSSSSYNTNTLPSKTVDGSGLSSGQHDTGFALHWFSDKGATATAQEYIQWDLGSSYVLDSIQVWNLNQNAGNPGRVTGNGIGQVDIYVSNATSPGDPEGAGALNWTLVAEDATFSEATGSATYAGFDLETQAGISLPTTAVRWVRFEIDSVISTTTNYNDTFDVGLSEVQFTAVPEPGSFALLGIGGLCMLKRRRR